METGDEPSHAGSHGATAPRRCALVVEVARPVYISEAGME
jgi:hypothetical protein